VYCCADTLNSNIALRVGAGAVAVPEALGGRVSHETFELCMAPPPPEEDQGAAGPSGAIEKELLLAASGLGQQHFLAPGSNLVRPDSLSASSI